VSTPGAKKGTSGAAAPEDGRTAPPLVRNGWRIYVWGDFRRTWTALRKEVADLAARHPEAYKRHPATIFLRDVRDIVLTEVPADPGSDRYRQGNKLGSKYRHWRRVKFRGRFRLFFRYSSAQKTIIYVWLNGPNTLRKEGDRSDPYRLFRTMLERRKPPTDWDDLMADCESWESTEVDRPGE
jgi:toxin YhaV